MLYKADLTFCTTNDVSLIPTAKCDLEGRPHTTHFLNKNHLSHVRAPNVIEALTILETNKHAGWQSALTGGLFYSPVLCRTGFKELIRT